MIRPASYSNGLAPRDGQPLYPELLRGRILALAPCLGPTGLTLRDWSGAANHGTLTNMAPASDWVVSGGRYSLDFDAVDDHVAATATLTQAFTMCCFVTFRSFKALQSIMTVGNAFANGFRRIDVSSAGAVTANYWTETNAVSASGVISLNVQYHIATTFDGTTKIVYVNGKNVASSVSSAVNVNATTVAIGRLVDFGDAYACDAILPEAAIYNRAISESECRLLSRRPGIAYELAPRRRSSAAVAGFNPSWVRRRSLVIGGGIN